MRFKRLIHVCITIGLALVLAALGYKSSKRIRSNRDRAFDTAAPIEAQAAPLALIRSVGLLANPKSLNQIGVPVEATRAPRADNVQSPDKIVLGQRLFFDQRLSTDGTVACSTCHDPALAFTDRRPVSIGVNGRAGQRNAPTILNALYLKTQFWDGHAKTLEEQAALPIVNPAEMGSPAWMQLSPGSRIYRNTLRRFAAYSAVLLNEICSVHCVVERTQFSLIRRSTTSQPGTGTQSATPLSEAGTFSTPKPGVTNAMRSQKNSAMRHSLMTESFTTLALASFDTTWLPWHVRRSKRSIRARSWTLM